MYYFKQVKDGKIVSVEFKSINVPSSNFIKATKAEYGGYIASLPVIIPKPPRDLAQEIDELRADIEELKAR